ncbi:hypothetical protein Q7C_1058 [Methylophaga frappieri]|uniref:Uncharacterized protein n=1 Tax=Methylophaga frappieri (strain ATCC BAA-2434 / DSM 25690 / JAM7) TaxID=754477 RepID=I1YH22_METFJ|nr:hypothetical protein [Methylophaga frappieri]AFJ02215.1 hypothetical protein Q7C_1058 [Methylophaga frappieri]
MSALLIGLIRGLSLSILFFLTLLLIVQEWIQKGQAKRHRSKRTQSTAIQKLINARLTT